MAVTQATHRSRRCASMCPTTATCSCKYCFASTGDFGTGPQDHAAGGGQEGHRLWSSKTSGKRHNIEVDFFGGEPLMAMDTVKATVEYARAHEGGMGQALPLHHDHQRRAAQSRRTSTISTRTWTTVSCLWTAVTEVNDRHRPDRGRQRAAMMSLYQSSRSWSRPAAIRTTITTCAAPLPATIWTSASRCDLSIADPRALTAFPWSLPYGKPDSDPYALREEDLPPGQGGV